MPIALDAIADEELATAIALSLSQQETQSAGKSQDKSPTSGSGSGTEPGAAVASSDNAASDTAASAVTAAAADATDPCTLKSVFASVPSSPRPIRTHTFSRCAEPGP